MDFFLSEYTGTHDTNTMPKLRKIGLTIMLSTALWGNVTAQQSNPLLNDAVRHFELKSFPTALQKFEQLLKDNAHSLPDA
jgi:hypothetical protein